MSLFRRIGYEIGRGICDALLQCTHEHPPFKPNQGRFAGVFLFPFDQGDSPVAQQLKANVAYTVPLTFTDTSIGATGPGPQGTVTASDSTVSPTFSADGQWVNFTIPNANADVTLIWHDPAGGVPDFTGEFTTAAVVITGSFGAAVEGTTP